MMCVAVYKPAGAILPSYREMRAMFESNPDGAGVAWTFAGSNEIKWQKGFFAHKDWTDRAHHIDDVTDNASSMILHARWATHGAISYGNCHPFPLTSSYKTMGRVIGTTTVGCVAHNGVLNMPAERTGPSDSMHAVRDVYKCKLHTGLSNNQHARRLLEMAFQGSRVVFLFPGGGAVMIGEWILDERTGCYISNNRWKGRL